MTTQDKLSRLGFELKPAPSNTKPDGVLLLHGLYENPFSMRDIANVLSKKGFYVKALLLPGHGTVPADLLTISCDAWITAVKVAVLAMRPQINRLFVVGFSTGAMLALHRQLAEPTFDAMVLMAPPFKLTWPINVAFYWRQCLSRSEWLTQRAEHDVMKYASATMQSVKQVRLLTRDVNQRLQKTSLTCPVFCVVSLEDATVATKPTLTFFDKYANKQSRILLYASHTFLSIDPRYTVRSSVHPDMRIKSLSHPAMVISPDNSHYGIDGDYALASHIKTEPSLHFGEYGRLGTLVHLGKFRRLTFNPDFQFMMDEMLRFLT